MGDSGTLAFLPALSPALHAVWSLGYRVLSEHLGGPSDAPGTAAHAGPFPSMPRVLRDLVADALDLRRDLAAARASVVKCFNCSRKIEGATTVSVGKTC